MKRKTKEVIPPDALVPKPEPAHECWRPEPWYRPFIEGLFPRLITEMTDESKAHMCYVVRDGMVLAENIFDEEELTPAQIRYLAALVMATTTMAMIKEKEKEDRIGDVMQIIIGKLGK